MVEDIETASLQLFWGEGKLMEIITIQNPITGCIPQKTRPGEIGGVVHASMDRNLCAEVLGVESEEVQSIEGAIAGVEIKIRTIDGAGRVWSEPSAEGWMVETSSEKDEMSFSSFGAKTPGAFGSSGGNFFTEGIDVMFFFEFAGGGDKGNDVTLKVMQGDVGGIEF